MRRLVPVYTWCMTVRSVRPKWQSRFHGVRMTPEEYLALPEEKPYLEYADGVVLQKPMVNSRHRDLTGELTLELGLYARRAGGKFGPEGRIAFPHARAYRLPDTAYWAPGRPSGDDSLPTLAVEVRSPEQSMNELRVKCRFYRANGIDACWLIDPESRTVEVFEGDTDGITMAEGTLTSGHMPGFMLALSDLFAVLDR